MADKEYIEREALIKHIERSFGEISTPFVVKEIKDFPTADVVEVVFCKDCVCFKQSISALFPETNCFICDNPYGLKRNIKETDYCSYGERRCEE